MFAVGSIIKMFAPTAGKDKFHLCVCCMNDAGIQKFLFINSGDGYEADFVVDDGEISGLPQSPTGKSVISCSMVLMHNEKQLNLYHATQVGVLSDELAGKVADFIEKTTALPKKQRDEIASNLRSATTTR